ncbi:MAG: ribonuclease P protein component [Clostridia bacterium]|nr:ribonuclease P protein component [Clostridia bacterium]
MTTVTVINQNKEFRTLYYHGRSQVGPLLVSYVRKRRDDTIRMGITTGKKLGNAVNRSRCRRLIREAFRLLLPHCRPGFDVVFVARGQMTTASMQQVQSVMKRQLIALGVYETEEGERG